ncbi:MAG: hypothetical protein ABIY55_35525 [Kofleriaceae bacterium]
MTLTRLILAAVTVITLACGPGPEIQHPFPSAGIHLRLGAPGSEKVLEVGPGGEVSMAGHRVAQFIGADLRSTAAHLSLRGDKLRRDQTMIGHFQTDALVIGASTFSVGDDGSIQQLHGGHWRALQMRFEGNMAGRRRAAIMLVIFVIIVYAEQFPDTLPRLGLGE